MPADPAARPGRRRRILAAAVALLPAVAGCGAGAERGAAWERERSRLVAQFERVAFSGEIGGAARHGRLIRWTGPISPRLLGPFTIDDRIRVAALLDRYADLAGLTVDAARPANFHIRRVGPRTVARAAGRPDPCYAEVTFDDAGVIVRADLYLARLGPDQWRHCLAEELFQAFGLLDDSDLVPGSLLNDASARPHASWEDDLLLHTLYDDRLRPGMGRSEAAVLLPVLIGERLRALRAPD